MEITYFEVYLKDGTTFDFDYKCNKVDYGKGNYIVCIHKEKDEELVYETLAIIPRENVKYILTKELWSTFAKNAITLMKGEWYYEIFFSSK